MYVKQFEKLPPAFQKSEIKPYFDYLQTRKGSLFVKRVLDIFVALLVLLVLSPIMLISALLIKLTTKGPLFYLQERVGLYGKPFHIYKFRTMVVNADKIGAQNRKASFDGLKISQDDKKVKDKFSSQDNNMLKEAEISQEKNQTTDMPAES